MNKTEASNLFDEIIEHKDKDGPILKSMPWNWQKVIRYFRIVRAIDSAFE